MEEKELFEELFIRAMVEFGTRFGKDGLKVIGLLKETGENQEEIKEKLTALFEGNGFKPGLKYPTESDIYFCQIFAMATETLTRVSIYLEEALAGGVNNDN